MYIVYMLCVYDKYMHHILLMDNISILRNKKKFKMDYVKACLGR